MAGAGSLLSAIVTAAVPSALVLTAVTVPAVPRPRNAPPPKPPVLPPEPPPKPPWPLWPKGAALPLLCGKGTPFWPLWPLWPKGAPLWLPVRGWKNTTVALCPVATAAANCLGT